MAIGTMQPLAVKATMNYHLEPARGGAEVWCPGTIRDKRRPHEQKEVTVTNIRGHEEDFTLDAHGFHVGPFTTSANMDDDTEIRGQYYEDVAAHVKKITGATKVLTHVHIARRQTYEEVVEAEKNIADDEPVVAPAPNRSVHVDQSYRGAELTRDSKLDALPEAEVEKLKRSRWAIINLWRPLNIVTRDNLALCDARTAEESELVPVYAELSDKLKNAKTGYNFSAKRALEAFEVKAPAIPGAHTWYYAANMRPDEALLIKQFDSKKHGVARRTPHSAFSAEDYGSTRQSIEVRCICFWEDQPQE